MANPDPTTSELPFELQTIEQITWLRTQAALHQPYLRIREHLLELADELDDILEKRRYLAEHMQARREQEHRLAGATRGLANGTRSREFCRQLALPGLSGSFFDSA